MALIGWFRLWVCTLHLGRELSVADTDAQVVAGFYLPGTAHWPSIRQADQGVAAPQDGLRIKGSQARIETGQVDALYP